MLDKINGLTVHLDPVVRFNSRQILHCVGVVPKRRQGIRILSIDGGGTRGIISIRFVTWSTVRDREVAVLEEVIFHVFEELAVFEWHLNLSS